MADNIDNYSDNQESTARFWSFKMNNDRLVCELCPRFCALKDGQRGMCFVRKREGQRLVLDTYGRSSGFCMDPIEKKPLNHFHPGTPVLSFGTAGCNLACKFCQNHEISKSRQMDSLGQSATPKEIAVAAKKAGAKSVAYTYNDPVIFHEYAIDIAKECKALDIKSVAVTAGYMNKEPREEFFSHMDAANIDLKSFSENFYRKITNSSLKPVLETIEYVANHTDCWLELTTLLIPDLNDSDEELTAMCDWIATTLGSSVPIHFSAFHPDHKMMDRPRTPQETLLRARDIAKKAGLQHVYVGNTHHKEGQSTYCANCNDLVIGRDWYQLSEWNLNDTGCCLSCNAPLDGHFSGLPGDWGRKRQRITFPPKKATMTAKITRSN